MRSRVSMVAVLALLLFAGAARANWWSPVAWKDESTLELRTTDPGQEPHWSTVWLVVVDGRVYVRLGARAAGRVERNATKPFVDVRVAGQEFRHVHAVPAPEEARRVGEAMAAKYWSDVLVRQVAHPLTLRLVPE
ncbi:MAG: hypothetical protein U0807_12700 [Candidatus Binatia bacterium]